MKKEPRASARAVLSNEEPRASARAVLSNESGAVSEKPRGLKPAALRLVMTVEQTG